MHEKEDTTTPSPVCESEDILVGDCAQHMMLDRQKQPASHSNADMCAACRASLLSSRMQGQRLTEKLKLQPETLQNTRISDLYTQLLAA